MIEFFHFKKDIPFMSYGKLTTSISLLTFVLAVVFLLTKGLNFGVDFTGGTVMEVHYPQPVELQQVREQLATHALGEATVQHFGSTRDVLIRLPLKGTLNSAQLSEKIMATLRTMAPQVELRRVEFVGPQVGQELVHNGLIALGLVCAGIMAYLALRFEWRFAVSAIVANLHDVVIILGCFALFQWEFSLTVLAAVLAVLGYSVNESVVVFDRIRENFRKMRHASVPAVIDNAITTTMSRTLITHGCTETMVLAMLVFGGEVLHGFAVALTIGIVFGIYSSVLVASPLALMLGVSRANLARVEKKKQEIVV